MRLIAFIVYQYLTGGDALVLSFQQAATALVNEGEQGLKETLYASRQTLAQLVGQVVRRGDTRVDVLTQLQQIVADTSLPDAQIVTQIRQLLFRHSQQGLRSGQLNVLASFEFRAVDDYQIPLAQWQAHRQAYLTKANLLVYERPASALLALGERLNKQYAATNARLETNPQLYFDKNGGWHLHRYETDEAQTVAAATRLYPTSRIIALRDVLEQVQATTDFLSAFTHQGFTADKPTRPNERLLLTARIGYGENIGICKMGLISKSISVNALETVATHYFSPEGVLRANDRILAQSNQLPLTDGSFSPYDGQKYDVSGPILRAAASFKYFSNGQSITIYSHLDEAGQLIYPVVFSAADRESTYMLDAITYNEVITPDTHSTDAHGATEAVFGVTGLLGVDFRPRFARVHHQQRYSLDAVSTYKELSLATPIVPGVARLRRSTAAAVSMNSIIFFGT